MGLNFFRCIVENRYESLRRQSGPAKPADNIERQWVWTCPKVNSRDVPVQPLAKGFQEDRLEWVTKYSTQTPTLVAVERFIKWPEIVEAWVHLVELHPSECVSACLVSTWKPATRHLCATHLGKFP